MAKVSPPVTPIIFWIEKTVPYGTAAPVREASWSGTRHSRRPASPTPSRSASSPTMPPGTPKTSTTTRSAGSPPSAGFAMGPSHVNPITGQILDADIIFDADFLRFWMRMLRALTRRSGRSRCADCWTWSHYLQGIGALPAYCGTTTRRRLRMYPRMTAAVGLRRHGDGPPAESRRKEQIEKLICQGVEVGRRSTKSATRSACGTISRPARY